MFRTDDWFFRTVFSIRQAGKSAPPANRFQSGAFTAGKIYPGITHVASSAQEAFQLGSGVCQDHTHLFLACTRHFGIAARYVSGYLHSETEEHSESHAWAEACIDGRWYLFDVSNLLFSPSQHVQIAIGLDYNDTAPIRGVRVGGGAEKMNYAVRIMNEQQQQSRFWK